MTDPWRTLDASRALLTGSYTIGPGNRSTTLVLGFGDRDLLVVSPGPDPTPESLHALSAHGRVRALLAPNGSHRAGITSWSAAFPDATVHTTANAAPSVRARIGPTEISGLDALHHLLGPAARLIELPDTRNGDVWVAAEGGALYAADTFTNFQPDSAGFAAFLWLLGMPRGLGRNPWQRRLMARDRPAYDRWVRDQLVTLHPTTLILGHGDAVLADDLTATLLSLWPR